MSPLDSLLRTLAHSVCTDRKMWAFLFLIIALLSLFSITQIKLSLDAQDFLPKKSTLVTDPQKNKVQEKMAAQFSGNAPTIVEIRGQKAIDVTKLAPLIEKLAKAFAQMDEVQKVSYRLESQLKTYVDETLPAKFLLYLKPEDLKQFSENISTPGIQALILGSDTQQKRSDSILKRDPLNLYPLASPYFFNLMAGFRLEFVDGYFASRGRDSFYMLITPKKAFKKGEVALHFTQKMDQIIHEIQNNPDFEALTKEIDITAMGRAHIFASTFETAKKDSEAAFTLSVISIFMLLMVFYRRLTASLMLIAPVCFGLLITAALAALFFKSVNLFALLFAAVLTGLGVDFAIHIGTHYWLHSGHIANREKAVIESMIRPGRGILFGALTTTAAFSALAFSQYPGIAQTGILTAIGILSMFFASITLFPFLMFRSKKSKQKTRGINLWTNLFIFVSARFPRVGVFLWLFFVLVAGLGVTRVHYEDHPWNVAVRGNAEAETLLNLNKRLGVSLTPILLISQGKTEEEAIQKDRQVARKLMKMRREAGIAFFQSISALLPETNQQQNNINFIAARPEIFSGERFRRAFHRTLKEAGLNSDTLLGDYTQRISEALSHPLKRPIVLTDLKTMGLSAEIKRHLGQNGKTYLAATYVYLKKFPWEEEGATRFSSVVQSANDPALNDVFIAGEGMASVSQADQLKAEIQQDALLAFAFVTFLLCLALKKWTWVSMALLPLISSVWITFGFMGFLGIEINFMTLSVIPILLGIGIDDGLHLIERYRKEGDLKIVLKETGSGLTATSLTTAFAFLSFGFAENQTVREFGWVASIGIGICLLASLHLLPCLIQCVKKNKKLAIFKPPHT